MNAEEIKGKIKGLVQAQKEIRMKMDAIAPGLGEIAGGKKEEWLNLRNEEERIEREIQDLDGKLIDLEGF